MGTLGDDIYKNEGGIARALKLSHFSFVMTLALSENGRANITHDISIWWQSWTNGVKSFVILGILWKFCSTVNSKGIPVRLPMTINALWWIIYYCRVPQRNGGNFRMSITCSNGT